MSVDDDGLAVLAEFAAFSGFARGAYRNAREDARAAASGRAGRYSVHEPIVRPVAVRVNCTFLWQCPKCCAGRRGFRSDLLGPMLSCDRGCSETTSGRSPWRIMMNEQRPYERLREFRLL